MSTPKPNVFTKERIEELKKKYGPDLVDALLTRAEDAELEAIYDHALQNVLNRGTGADQRYDELAVERRKQEAAIIKEEVVIFREMGKLMSSVNERYRMLTGLPPRAPNQET